MSNEHARISVGMEANQPPSPELPAAPVQPLATEQPSAPSVSGSTALAWWHAMKYEWKRSARGNQYLAPQESYVADVLDRADVYTTRITARLTKDDFAEFDAAVVSVQESIQNEDAYDMTGTEGHGLRRYYLGRLVLARKICGTTAVSAEHRTINEMSRRDGDVVKMQADSEGYYAADIEKRESWGQKAVRLEYIVKAIADGEVIPTDTTALNELISKRITNGKNIGLGDEAFELGKTLQRPPQAVVANIAAPSREELLAMTA